LIDKLQNSRVRPIIYAILSGADIEYNEFSDDLKYVEDLGIVVKDLIKDGVKISNQILFELKNSVVLSWKERIKWAEVEYESFGVKKQFSVVEM